MIVSAAKAIRNRASAEGAGTAFEDVLPEASPNCADASGAAYNTEPTESNAYNVFVIGSYVKSDR